MKFPHYLAIAVIALGVIVSGLANLPTCKPYGASLLAGGAFLIATGTRGALLLPSVREPS